MINKWCDKTVAKVLITHLEEFIDQCTFSQYSPSVTDLTICKSFKRGIIKWLTPKTNLLGMNNPKLICCMTRYVRKTAFPKYLKIPCGCRQPSWIVIFYKSAFFYSIMQCLESHFANQIRLTYIFGRKKMFTV